MGPETEVGIGGPKMSPKQLARYNADLKKRAEKEGWSHKLYGRYLNPPELTESEDEETFDEEEEGRSSLLRELIGGEPEPEVIPDDPLNTSMIDYMPKKKWMKKKKKHKDDLFD